jgi:hypothetical protein
MADPERWVGVEALSSLLCLPTCFHVSFMLGILSDPEDGGDMFS